MSARAEWATQLWADRCRKLRVVLDSYRRRGETWVWAKDAAPLLRLPAETVQRMGREYLDALQLEGIKVGYTGGAFTLSRPDLRVL